MDKEWIAVLVIIISFLVYLDRRESRESGVRRRPLRRPGPGPGPQAGERPGDQPGAPVRFIRPEDAQGPGLERKP